jgi:CRISPR-associated protein Cas2
MTMFYLVCFDVREEKRLRKISIAMEDFGIRVQRSVFECHLESFQLQTLKQRVSGIMNPDLDHVRYYPLCGKDKKRIVVDGIGTVSNDPEFHLL